MTEERPIDPDPYRGVTLNLIDHIDQVRLLAQPLFATLDKERVLAKGEVGDVYISRHVDGGLWAIGTVIPMENDQATVKISRSGINYDV